MIYGYDRIPSFSPHANMAMLPASEKKLPVLEMKRLLTVRDYHEVINYAFVDESWECELVNNSDPIELMNPIASQMSVMRSTLIGGLISNLQFNLNRKQTRVRLFEVGCCFGRTEDNHYCQLEKLAGLSYGDVVAEQWGIPEKSVDFYDVKADVEILFKGRNVHFSKFSHPALHPGKTARITIDGQSVGWLGELHPHWQKKYGLQKNAVLFEIDLDSLLQRTIPTVTEVSKFPPIRRDVAVLVDNDINVQTLLDGMYAEKSEIVTDISLFDIYRGKDMGDTKKSLAFRVLLQDTEKTLTDAEADSAVTQLIEILKNKFGATLRN